LDDVTFSASSSFPIRCPYFQKMLYSNSLLILSALFSFSQAWLAHPKHSSVVRTSRFLASQDEAERLKEQAKRLREEINAFEQMKETTERDAVSKREKELAEQRAQRELLSAVVPILKPDGSTQETEITFPPFHPDDSFITVCEANLPLGLILGESEDFAAAVVVDEVAEQSNGEIADVRVGDIVRAFTACKMQMEQPAWQLIAGGIGRPKTFRFMYSVDNRPFEEVMEAVASNRFDPEGRPVLLVLERKNS
jgi:hypothetical protein